MKHGGLTGLTGLELAWSIVGALALLVVAAAGGWAAFAVLIGLLAGLGLAASVWGKDSRDGRDW
jgi:O-antigen/teichoic acid export membrane protein